MTDVVDSTTAPGTRVDAELEAMIEKAAKAEGDDLGRASANAQELVHRSRAETQARQERESNRWAWVRHHEAQRRAHLEIALQHRAKARALASEMVR